SVKELVCSSEEMGCPNSPMISTRLAPVTRVVGVNGLGCLMAITSAQPEANRPHRINGRAVRISFVVFMCFLVLCFSVFTVATLCGCQNLAMALKRSW